MVRDATLTRIAADGSILTETELVVETRGTNLKEILQFPQIDLPRLITNDIRSVADVFGIHTAAQCIDDQMQEVIQFNGTSVNSRHSRLLGDVMCFSGEILPMNRFGVLRDKPSVLQRVSFEQAAEKLYQAGAYAQRDPLIGATENTMVGNLTRIGSNLSRVVCRAPLEPADPELKEKNRLTILSRTIPFPGSVDKPLSLVTCNQWIQSVLETGGESLAPTLLTSLPLPVGPLSCSFAGPDRMDTIDEEEENDDHFDFAHIFAVVEAGSFRHNGVTVPARPSGAMATSNMAPRRSPTPTTTGTRGSTVESEPKKLRACKNSPQCQNLCFSNTARPALHA